MGLAYCRHGCGQVVGSGAAFCPQCRGAKPHPNDGGAAVEIGEMLGYGMVILVIAGARKVYNKFFRKKDDGSDA